MTQQVYSDPVRKDSDGDGLDDKVEKERGLHPYQKDSDEDGIHDSIDTEITHSNGRLNVNAQGKYTPGATGTQNSLTLDSDGDTVLDTEDMCPNTPANKIVDESGTAKGCSAEQKVLDSDNDNTPDYRDNDSDNDGLSDTLELSGWKFTIPIVLNPLDPENNSLSFTGTSDTRLKDTDGDGVEDNIEKQR